MLLPKEQKLFYINKFRGKMLSAIESSILERIQLRFNFEG